MFSQLIIIPLRRLRLRRITSRQVQSDNNEFEQKYFDEDSDKPEEKFKNAFVKVDNIYGEQTQPQKLTHQKNYSSKRFNTSNKMDLYGNNVDYHRRKDDKFTTGNVDSCVKNVDTSAGEKPSYSNNYSYNQKMVHKYESMFTDRNADSYNMNVDPYIKKMAYQSYNPDSYNMKQDPYDDNYGINVEKQKLPFGNRITYLKTAVKNCEKKFSDKSTLPINSFTSRFQKQELIDFFDFHKLETNGSETITNENKNKEFLKQFAPLFDVPYKDQLAMKQRHAVNILKKLQDFMRLHQKCYFKKFGKRKCIVTDIIPIHENMTPSVTKVAIDGDPITVGYYLGKSNFIVSPLDSPNISELHKLVIKHFEKFLSLPCNNIYSYHVREVWMDLIIKSNFENNLMIIGVLNSRRLQKSFINDIEHNFRKYFIEGHGKECSVSSILLKCSYSEVKGDVISYPDEEKRQKMESTMKVLYGKDHLIDIVSGQSFIIRSDTVFQSRQGAEVLYNEVKKLIGDVKNTIILDLCCGSGGLGIQLAPHAKQVIGIDVNEMVIEDAMDNVEINKLNNCTHLKGKIQQVLPELKSHLSQGEEVIAIINAPQFGIGASTIKCIRQCSFIKKIIYISWRPSCTIPNMGLILMKDNDVSLELNDPFIPITAVPIDMYPHTVYTQLLLLYKRIARPKKRRNYGKRT